MYRYPSPVEQAEKLKRHAQMCLQDYPAIVLGSGYSAGYGLASMSELAHHLAGIDSKLFTGTDVQKWEAFTSNVASQQLEAALTAIGATDAIMSKVIRETWNLLQPKDRNIKLACVENPQHLALTRLIEHLFTSSHNILDIVTTNYDRLAEYAAESAGAIATSGFSPGCIGNRLNGSKLSFSRGGYTAREVRIWKVHGSIDWFQTQGTVVRTDLDAFDERFNPMMITPGVEKYQRSLKEPFRSVLTGADEALTHANGFLCIGYGFNDDHIQEKLVERVQRHRRRTTILSKQLTPASKAFLGTLNNVEYLAIEESGDKSKAFSSDFPEGVELEEPNLWRLDTFLKWSTGK